MTAASDLEHSHNIVNRGGIHTDEAIEPFDPHIGRSWPTAPHLRCAAALRRP